MVVDCFTYNGEADLLDLHLNALNDYVDRFVLVEAATTFSGKHKPLYFAEQQDRFERWRDRIQYFVNEEDYSGEEIALAEGSPNTAGAAHWKHEFLQKERIKEALKDYPEDATVYVGDVDEIWEPRSLQVNPTPIKLRLRVYTYWLNNRSTEPFYGTVKATNKLIQAQCLNHLRVNAPRSKDFLGWHFTSMGGAETLSQKLTDSYTQESYATPEVLQNLAYNVENSRDFLGRDFQYAVDEKDWPQYLKDNRANYEHLCR